MAIKPMNISKMNWPYSALGSNPLVMNNLITMNTDMGFAGRIIGKYSKNGQYFFSGIGLTFLNFNHEETVAGIENNHIYLSLKLLIAYNYQQLYETMSVNNETYRTNIIKVLMNHLNQLKLTNQRGFEYINQIYQRVGENQSPHNRERLQEVLEERVQQLYRDTNLVITKEQSDTLKQLSILKRDNHNRTLSIDDKRRDTNRSIQGYTDSLSRDVIDTVLLNRNALNSDELHSDALNTNELSIDVISSDTLIINKRSSDALRSVELRSYDFNSEELDRKISDRNVSDQEVSNRIVSEQEVADRTVINRIVSDKEVSNREALQTDKLSKEIVSIETVRSTGFISDVFAREDINNDILKREALHYDKSNTSDADVQDISTDEDDTVVETVNNRLHNTISRNDTTETEIFDTLNGYEQMEEFTDLLREYDFTDILQRDQTMVDSRDSNTHPMKEELLYDNSILIDAVTKKSKPLTEKDRVLFGKIVRDLGIEDHLQNELLQELKQDRMSASHYRTILSKLLETMDQEVKRETFIKRLTQNNISIEDARRWMDYLSMKNIVVLQKKDLVNYLDHCSENIRTRISKLLLEENETVIQSVHKEELQSRLNRLTDQEMLQLTLTIVKQDKEIYNNLLENRLLVVKEPKHNDPDPSYQEPFAKYNEAILNYVSSPVIETESLEKEYSILSQKRWINRFNNSSYFLKLVMNKQFPFRYDRKGDTKDTKEKLKEILLSGDHLENQILLREIESTLTEEELISLQDLFIEQGSSYEDWSSTNRLVHILHSSDAVRLKEILRIMSTNPVYQRKLEEAFSQIRSMSSIMQYQKKLLDQRCTSEVKERLIRKVLNGSETERKNLTELIQTTFSAKERIELLQGNDKLLTRLSQNNVNKEEMTELLHHMDHSRLERLLHTLLLNKLYNVKEMIEMVEQPHHKLQRSGMTFPMLEISREIDTGYPISSIQNYRNKMRMQRYDSYLKDKLIQLVTSKTQENNRFIRSILQQELQLDHNSITADQTLQINRVHTEQSEEETLIYYIKNADGNRLEKMIDIINESPGRQLKMKQMITRLSERERSWTNTVIEKKQLFESSIVRNKLRLEERHSQRILHNFMKSMTHQDILQQNILLQRRMLELDNQDSSIETDSSFEMQNSRNVNQKDTITGNDLKHKQERSGKGQEEAVKKIVNEYFITEEAQMNYSRTRKAETVNELRVQKNEIRKLKEHVQHQNQTVEELKKQLARDRQAENKVDVNKITNDVMKIMQRQIMVAKMRKGLD